MREMERAYDCCDSAVPWYRRFCAARLAPFKIPRTVVFLDAIPLTTRGKTDRAALDAVVRARIRA